MDWTREIEANLDRLRANEYPGRGIIIGLSPDGNNFIQVYWLMGRSAASRNRILVQEGEFVRTAVPGEEELEDPSLLLYYPVKHWDASHIVTNGDQTDTIYTALQKGTGFAEALATRTFEPDPPHYTPRISGLVELNNPECAYRLAILKTAGGSPDVVPGNTLHRKRASWDWALHTSTPVTVSPCPPLAVSPTLSRFLTMTGQRPGITGSF